MKSITVEITAQEKEIVYRLADGEVAEEIGKSLGYVSGTFAGLMKEMRIKFGAKNSVHLVAIFFRQNIIK